MKNSITSFVKTIFENDETISISHYTDGFEVTSSMDEFTITENKNSIEIIGAETYVCIRYEEVVNVVTYDNSIEIVYENIVLEISRG